MITDPRALGEVPRVKAPRAFLVDDGMIVPPSTAPENVEIVRGPNIKPLPEGTPLAGSLEGEVLIKVGDDITTDPGGDHAVPGHTPERERVLTMADALGMIEARGFAAVVG